MENEVSALMDGELESEDVSRVVEMLDRNSELKQHWETYHLIGDALRQSSQLSMNLSEAVATKLKDEPIIYSPNVSELLLFKKQKRKIATLALAASVVLGISTWLGLDHSSQEADKQILAEKKMQETIDHSVVPITVSSQLQPIKNGPVVFERSNLLLLQNEMQPIYTNYISAQRQNNSTPRSIEYHKKEITE
ncbi:anti sigma-E protein, RseA [Nitrosomonas sp. PY1]|uniref:sigma-E factor negative regulatory protein n=1 Tax=Nitrosomonas sp. PY1 TaxID=1803906 RepID=UPI001FC87B98|nr:sigma-E factor negative regulatory protein [Nitrosomonas sp. PY1]GKS69639.1 anti sigma-E protein, RseA [Nitrosomonas sp. PY1]